MEFNSYLKLLQDFDIYPSITSKSFVHSIFYSLAQRYTEIYHKECLSDLLNSNSESIDEVLFYQSLIVISISANMPHYTDDIQKVCGLVERMSQSNGPV